MIDPLYPIILQPDSSQTIRGKNPLCLAQTKQGKYLITLNGTIHQSILLPKTNVDSATVTLICKSKNLQHAQLIISERNDQELILHSDTLSLLGSEDWSTFSRTVPIQDVALLHLNIVADGIKYSILEQRLYLDKIEIKIDGKDINDFPLPIIPTFSDLKKSDYISLSSSDYNSYNKIPGLENRKIVAIGEIIHGSENIGEAAVQLIKYQVEHNHCKLILLEQSTEQTLYWNRFIQGDSLFKIDNYARDFTFALSSPKVMVDLFNWLKHYNERVEEKVWLLGMDIPLLRNQSAESLYDYISAINESKHNILLDSLCSKLLNYNLYGAVKILQNQTEIEKLLGKNEFKIVRYCLNTAISFIPRSKERSSTRDDQMYLKVTFLMRLLCPGDEKTTIYAHFGHTNHQKGELSLSFVSPFGYYMKNKFGKDYYSIAALAGEGNFRTVDQDSVFISKKLEIPPVNSLEDLFMRTHEEACFVPVSNLPSQLTYMRDVGNKYRDNQFGIIAPASRMDAAIFVRNSRAFDLLPGTPTNSKELIIQYNRVKDRYKQLREKQTIVK